MNLYFEFFVVFGFADEELIIVLCFCMCIRGAIIFAPVHFFFFFFLAHVSPFSFSFLNISFGFV